MVPARTSWSASAGLASHMVMRTPAKLLEELFPALYHQYLHMFQKSALQGLPPHHYGNEKV
ncbi:uncharacterized protein VP01_13700g1 [Puccinia sorghi]|uniref:Uncharacterized protein n=1 Tax=Puccinia sorghi TaxID=27349 RepID=A0A0L6VLV9_9BASI|nr:uncharacterized protein VP01_13700g1 [Puccinia sorghi]